MTMNDESQPTGNVAELLNDLEKFIDGKAPDGEPLPMPRELASAMNGRPFEHEFIDQLRTHVTALQDKVSLYECKELPELKAENAALQSRNEFLELALKGTAESEAEAWELVGELIKPERTQVPREKGGGVVCKCRHCGANWWLDEHEPKHEHDCPAVKAQKAKKVYP